jgi:hypothetical protein
VNAKIETLNPINYKSWNELLLSNNIHSTFYTSGWSAVLYEADNYWPLYFVLLDNNKCSAIKPDGIGLTDQ